MLRSILILLAGCTLGVLGTLGTAYYVFVHQAGTAVAPPAGAQLGAEQLRNAAQADDSDCPAHGPEILIGAWQGEKYFPNEQRTQVWYAERYSDGTFEIKFMESDSPESVKAVETGYWGYSRCIYTTIIQTVNGSPVHFQEAYRVHHVDDRIMRYSNYRSGRTYELQRIR